MDKQLTNSNRNRAGFSLVELMVGIAVGLIVVSGIMVMFGSTIRLDRDTLASARLNQEMSTGLQIMSNELVRAGYSGPAEEVYGDTNRDGDDEEVDIDIATAGCVLYSYNRNLDGAIDNDERNGFKLDGGELQMRTDCTGAACGTDCGLGNWVSLTDPNVVTINDLTFTSTGSKCRYINDETYWSVDSETSAIFACAATSANVCTDDDDDGVYACGTAAPPTFTDNDHTVDVRQVNIVLQGELANDDSVTKTLQISAKVMNHMVRYVPGS